MVRQKRSRRKSVRAVFFVVGLLLVVAWFGCTGVIISLQIDKAKMTILREDELEDLFYVTPGDSENVTLQTERASIDDARKDASTLYQWLVPGSPKELLPWDDIVDDPNLVNISAPGHS